MFCKTWKLGFCGGDIVQISQNSRTCIMYYALERFLKQFESYIQIMLHCKYYVLLRKLKTTKIVVETGL